MAKIIIGGVEREGDLDTFAKLEAAWPHMKAAETAPDAMAQLSAMAGVTAVAIGMDIPEFKATLKRTEVPGMKDFFGAMLEESKVSKSGEGNPAKGRARRSTGTSTQSTPS
jgi:hypothetical protein